MKMNKFFAMLTMFAVVAGFAACGGDDEEETGAGGTPSAPATGLNAYPNRVVSANGIVLAASKQFVEVGSTEEIQLAVYKDGVDVTASATIYQIVNGKDQKVNGTKVVCSEVGTYSFWASYKGNNTKQDAVLSITTLSARPALAADAQPAASDFVRKVLLVQGTGIACQYCPNAIKAIKDFYATSKWAEHTYLMALHTYTSGDPLYSAGAEKLRIQAGFSGYPVMLLNFDSEYFGSSMNSASFYAFLNNSVAEILDADNDGDNDDAEVGISIATAYNAETGVISVNSAIKCDDPAKYKVTAVLLQDNVYFRQTGALDESQNIHEAGVKAISPANGAGFALNSGELTKEGATYEYCCEFSKDDLVPTTGAQYTLDVLRDARILVYVQANGKVVENVAVCGMNEQVGFAYEAE